VTVRAGDDGTVEAIHIVEQDLAVISKDFRQPTHHLDERTELRADVVTLSGIHLAYPPNLRKADFIVRA
jgi:hypothetical protein